MTDKLLIVLEVNEQSRVPDVVEKLRQHLEAGEVTITGYDRGYVATGTEAEMILDVFKEPELGGGRHVADIRLDDDDVPEWVIEHSLVCRRSGKMTDCPWIARVSLAANDVELPLAGRWVLALSEDDGELEFYPAESNTLEANGG